jgi:prolyl oligopeptidase
LKDSCLQKYRSLIALCSVLYKQASPEASPEVFLDPNTLSDDGTVALGTYSFSKSGKLFSYAVSKSGSDWVEISIKDAGSKADKQDRIEWAKFTSISWSHDDLGFFYNRYPKPEHLNQDDAGTETDANMNCMVLEAD